jgi:hypothetical protein
LAAAAVIGEAARGLGLAAPSQRAGAQSVSRLPRAA